MPAYRVSKLTHVYERGEVVAIFHSLTYEVLFAGQEIKKLLNLFETGNTIECVLDAFDITKTQVVQETVNSMIENGFLILTTENEYRRIEEMRDRLVGYPEISILYLLLTGMCNMRCDYCFVETPDIPYSYQRAMMSKDTAKRGIDLYASALAENPENKLITRNVYFYGGEPLLNWEVLRYSAKYMLQLKQEGILPKQLVLNMVTNGTLVSKSIARELAALGVQVSVSLDGPEEVTGKNRQFASGNSPVFPRIIQGIRLLQEAGVEVGISCTIKGNENRLPEIVSWLHNELGVNSLGFNVLMGKRSELDIDDTYFETVAREMLRAFETARELGVYEDRMMRKVRAFVDQTPYPKDCGGCGRQLVVTADGKVGPCHAYAAASQRYYKPLTPDYNPLHDSDILEWSKRSPLSMPGCYQCPAVAICGGGCAYHADMNYGDIWAIDDRFCYQAKSAVEWLIWDLHRQGK